MLKLLLFDIDVLRLSDFALSLFAVDADSLIALLSDSLLTSDADSLTALLALVLWLSAVDADALTDAALSLSDALFTSDADSLADAALFDKLSLSEVDFNALSFAEVEADLLSDSLVALLVLVL